MLVSVRPADCLELQPQIQIQIQIQIRLWLRLWLGGLDRNIFR